MTTSQLPATRVLIVEDEEELRDAMISFLALEGLAAQGVGSLDATESWMQSQDFDVLVLDLGLPDGDGLAWLAQRKELQDKGVIITTARSLGQERVSGVKAGADVYLVKPVLLEELSSLIRNLARRIQPSAAAPAWTLDLLAWLILSPDGQVVKLTHSEHTLLGALARAQGLASAHAGLQVLWLTPMRALAADTTRALLQRYGAEFRESRKGERTVFVIANREGLDREEHPYALELARELKRQLNPISFSMP